MSSEYFLSLSIIEVYCDSVLPSIILPVLSIFILALEEVNSNEGPKFILPELIFPPIDLTYRPGKLFESAPIRWGILLSVGTPKEAIRALRPLSVPLLFNSNGKLW